MYERDMEQAQGSTLSTHVLDTAAGQPAAGIRVMLERLAGDDPPHWMGGGETDEDGRLRLQLAGDERLGPGTYRLTFDTGAYLAREAAGRTPFYPEVTVTFTVGTRAEHYHVPLLLSPFGYSTYRAS